MRKYCVVIAAVLAVACVGGKKVTEPSAEEFASYVSAYTAGVVSDDAVIRVKLARNADATPQEDLFVIKPELKGSVRWDGPMSVCFVPESGALVPGGKYSVEFNLPAVMQGAPSSFNFGIAVRGEATQEDAEEELLANGFGVIRASKSGDHVRLVLNERPVNASLKGMVELRGALRYYVHVKDSLIDISFESADDVVEAVLDRSLKSASGKTLGSDFHKSFDASDEKPAVEIPLKGNILPDKDRLVLPLRAVNLSAVELRIIKVYASNVLMYLQDNELGGLVELRRSGRLVYRGDIPLDATKDLHKWNTHGIDLSGLLTQEPGAIYSIRVSFRQDQSLYGGKEPEVATSARGGKPSREDDQVWDQQQPYYWDNFYDWEKYEWSEAGDPAKPSYYMDASRFPAVQLISSDIGLMAQADNLGGLDVVATDLITARPLPGVSLEVFDFQLKSLGKAKTDKNGIASFRPDRKAFAVVAKAGGSVAYLKLSPAAALDVSRFDTGGQVRSEGGLKAFMYGDRGVWRPGDTVNLSVIVADSRQKLPKDHPASLDVYTPEGRFHSRFVAAGHDGFYCFGIPTDEGDPTGYWKAVFTIGESVFSRTLNVENIKPNRLRINADYPQVLELGKESRVQVESSWLSGASASGLQVKSVLKVSGVAQSPFRGYSKYTFSSPSPQPSASESQLFAGVLQTSGKASFSFTPAKAPEAPGMLKGTVITSVMEPGGDESFVTGEVLCSPFKSYVGIRLPEGEYLETDRDNRVDIAVLGPDGKRVKGHRIEYAVFKTGWSWWWDASARGGLSSYVNGSFLKTIAEGGFVSGSGDYSFNIRENYPEWGRYLVLARDTESGHVSGRAFTIDWPEYRGRADRKDPEAATHLSISADKASYTAGEKVTVYIPAAPGARALVSVENSVEVLRREWVETSDKDTPWTFTAEPSMAPDVFVHVTLIQPYKATEGNLPIRLYGFRRVKIEAPETILEPVIAMPERLEPGQEFTVKVSEKKGRPMTYTLAIVDEGLLDITSFKTPDPWEKMYRQEALGVTTWDMFDRVIGADASTLSTIAAIGGDEDAVKEARKDNRFNPVVLFVPARTVEKGADAVRLTMPVYIGSVRVMVVASRDNSFGRAWKTVPVESPLMTVSSAPERLGPGEETLLAVNVFSSVGDATVSVKADGPVSLLGSATQKAGAGGVLRFRLKALDKEGDATLRITSRGGGHAMEEELKLLVRNNIPDVLSVKHFRLEAGEEASVGSASVQVNSYPAPNFDKILSEVSSRSYGGSYGLAASGITLLHLRPQSEAIPQIIAGLYGSQLPDGGWPLWEKGRSSALASSMAGQFLAEASSAGYEVNAGVLGKWKNYQNSASRREYSAAEAYRLYTLVLAGDTPVAAMNRLRESSEIGAQARYILSAAYSLSGKRSQASALLEVPENEQSSSLEDRLWAMYALILCDRIPEALTLAQECAQALDDATLQDYALASVAYGTLEKKLPSGNVMTVRDGDTLRNDGDVPVYVTTVAATRGTLKAVSSSALKMEVSYADMDGRPLNPASLKQGTQLRMIVTLTNTAPARNLSALSLRLPLPSGWETREGDIPVFDLPASSSRSFSVECRAAYEGRYVLPSVSCKSLTDSSVFVASQGGTAEVTR